MSSDGEFHLRMSHDGMTGYANIPGFGYLDEDNQYSVTELKSQASWRAVVLLWQGNGFLYACQRDELGKHCAYNFIKYRRMEVSREYLQAIHRYQLDKADDVPMKGKAEVVHIGKTSSTVRSEVYNARTGQLYCWADLLYVHVDKGTRKASPYPDHILRKYKPRGQQQPVKVEVVTDIPQDSLLFWDHVLIVERMIDMNNHTSVMNYEDFAVDALDKAFHQGHFKHENRAAGEGVNVKMIGMLYQGESRLGDEIRIGVWRDEKQNNLFHVVMKLKERVILNVELAIFDEVPAVSAQL